MRTRDRVNDIKDTTTAHEFVEAIKYISEKPDALQNLEAYLSYHFPEWLEKYANTPESLTAEIKAFGHIFEVI